MNWRNTTLAAMTILAVVAVATTVAHAAPILITITNNTSFGYGYAMANYSGLVYIYYTELTPSGIAVIRGVAFNGTAEMKAPLPVFNDLGEASPLLVVLDNGSLMMIWAGVPATRSNLAIANKTANATLTSKLMTLLSNLTILLQASVLHGDTWGPVVNLTTSGDAMAYASDGEYIYLVYEPKLTLTYNNTILEELTPSGRVVKALSIPGIIGIIGFWNGLIVQFLNGTQALVNMSNGSITQIPLTLTMGYTNNGLTYYFNTNSKILTIINGSRVVVNLTLPSPWYEYAYPLQWGSGFIIIAWGPMLLAGLLSALYWNGTGFTTLANYTLKTSFIVPGVDIVGHYLYLAWQEVENLENGTSSIYLAIIPLPTPSQATHTAATTTTARSTITTTTTTVTRSTTTTVIELVTTTVPVTTTVSSIVNRTVTVTRQTPVTVTVTVTSTPPFTSQSILVTIVIVVIVGVVVFLAARRYYMGW
jgi:hypothetical protein